MKPIIKVATGTTASISETVGFGNLSSLETWELDELKLHLSAAATAANTLTVTQRSHYGSQYDCKLFSQLMTTVQDLLQQWTRPIKLNGMDRVTVAWTNDAGADAKTWGLQINCKA